VIVTVFIAGFVACLIACGLALCVFVFLCLRAQVFPADPLPEFFLGFGIGAATIQGADLMARITTEQRVLLTINPLTEAGNPAEIDGAVLFESSAPNVVSIDVVDDRSAWAVSTGAIGAAQITASFDADLGEGVRTVTLSGALEVVGAEAVTGELVFGTPELIPPADEPGEG